MSKVEQLAQEQFNTFKTRMCEILSEVEEEIKSAYEQGYAKGETDEHFRTKQVVTGNEAKMQDVLQRWYDQHHDKSYTETFYQKLIEDTERLLWSNEGKNA